MENIKTIEQMVRTVLFKANNGLRPSYSHVEGETIVLKDNNHVFNLTPNGDVFKKLVRSGNWMKYGNVNNIGFVLTNL